VIFQTVETLRAPLVLASDLHIKDFDSERGRLLLDCLKRIEATEYFVLNGDVFDFCFGGIEYYRNKFKPLALALNELKERGSKVLYLEGNHEFNLNGLGWANVQIITERDFLLTLPSCKNRRILISHGDLLSGDFWYKIYRGMVKSKLASFCANIIPGQMLDRLCLRHAEGSRARDSTRALDHKRLLQQTNEWLDTGNCDDGIIGHYHVPYAEPRVGTEGLLLSVDCWDRPNFLIFDGESYKRAFPIAGGFQMESCQSLFS
jgi:UDP-2,3-diacylglucosamine hydrolase